MFSLFYPTSSGLHPCFVVFDVLLVNGRSIASLPLNERLENLEKYDQTLCTKMRFKMILR